MIIIKKLQIQDKYIRGDYILKIKGDRGKLGLIYVIEALCFISLTVILVYEIKITIQISMFRELIVVIVLILLKVIEIIILVDTLATLDIRKKQI